MRKLMLLGVVIMSVDPAHAALLEAVQHRDVAGLERALIDGHAVDERDGRVNRHCWWRSGTMISNPPAG